jgi:SWI/SNF-related matrix-associated actin-dependent regulator 1 of chromatin subfamily A
MTTLFKYQKKGVRGIELFAGRALLADSMGLGKTIQALWWAKNYLEEWPVFIVCPAYLKRHWAREARKHFDIHVEVLEGTRPQPAVTDHFLRNKIYVLNYDILSAWLPYLINLEPELVILDEAHMVKSRNAKRTKAAKQLCRASPHVLALTGTPMTNRPSELFPILNMIRPDVYNSFWSYAKSYCNPQKKPWGWEFKGAEHLDKLHAELKSTLMIRRLKEDVLKDLPSKQRFVIPFKLRHKKEYDLAHSEFIKWLRRNFGGRNADRAARAERMVKMGYLKRLAAVLKLPDVADWVEDTLEESDGKLILFGVHKKVLLPLFDKFRDTAVLVTGKVAAGKRQLLFDKFVNDRKTRLLVGNIQAAGTGWSATGTSVTAFAEVGWTPAEHSQAEDRTHGINRGIEGTRSTSYYLVAEDTIEEYLLSIIQDKQQVTDEALDGRRTEGGLNVYDLLTKKLLGGE